VGGQDEVIGRASKEDVRAKDLLCRVAFIMITNRNGEFLLNQNSGSNFPYEPEPLKKRQHCLALFQWLATVEGPNRRFGGRGAQERTSLLG
jgi:hypothetical protein